MTRIWQLVAVIAYLAALAATAPGHAQEAWNPFREKDEAVKRVKKTPEALPPPLLPMNGAYPKAGNGDSVPDPRDSAQPGFGAAYPGADTPPAYAQPLPEASPGAPRQAMNSSKVERIELEPAVAKDGGNGRLSNGLPPDAWRGMDVKAVEDAFGRLTLPPRSVVLHGLWVRLLTTSADTPSGGRTPGHFDAVLLEALYRSGLVSAMGMRPEGSAPDDPVFQSFAIRRDLALGQRESACQTAKQLIAKRAELPKLLAGELHLMAGYCAAAEGNAGGAGVAADLAREEGVDAPVALAALEALAGNTKGALTPPKQVRVLDYRLLELLGPIEPEQVLDKAEPALIAAMAIQETAEPRLRVAAGEAAARINAISTEQLAAIYRAAPEGADDATLRRAELVRVISAEQGVPRKLQLMKAVMDDARRSGLMVPMARVLAPMLAGVTPSPSLQVHAETAVEIALAAGETRQARAFAMTAGARHWLPLIDIAEREPGETSREQNLGSLDEFVRRGRFPAELLHRLATVLDATDVNVPIPLWEAASRTPQPATGYLPETGVLALLQEAAKKKEMARTVLLVMRSLGPAGPDGAHIIALADVIRALRRAGLESEARGLGVEALIAQWPRGGAS